MLAVLSVAEGHRTVGQVAPSCPASSGPDSAPAVSSWSELPKPSPSHLIAMDNLKNFLCLNGIFKIKTLQRTDTQQHTH